MGDAFEVFASPTPTLRDFCRAVGESGDDAYAAVPVSFIVILQPAGPRPDIFKIVFDFLPALPCHELTVVEAEVLAGDPPPVSGRLTGEIVDDPAFGPLIDLVAAGGAAPDKALCIVSGAVHAALSQIANAG